MGGLPTSPPPSAIVPTGDFANCVETACEVDRGDDIELSFDVGAIKNLKSKDIKVVATGGADVDNVSYSSRKGTVIVDLETPDKKDKSFTVTVKAGNEEVVLNFKT